VAGNNDSPVFALAFFCLAIAIAVRSGAVPFHVPAAHLLHSATSMAPALLLVWIPAGLGLLALSWSATTFGIRSDWLNAAVAGVQAVAVATIVLGALAALTHDEIEEVVAYSIVGDAGFLLLAFAARNDAAAEPAGCGCWSSLRPRRAWWPGQPPSREHSAPRTLPGCEAGCAAHRSSAWLW